MRIYATCTDLNSDEKINALIDCSDMLLYWFKIRKRKWIIRTRKYASDWI